MSEPEKLSFWVFGILDNTGIVNGRGRSGDTDWRMKALQGTCTRTRFEDQKQLLQTAMTENNSCSVM